MSDIQRDDANGFIAEWKGSTASELSTAQSFALDLCRLLGVEAPHADAEQRYMFERPVTFRHGDGSESAGRIDLYKRGCFVLEAKKLKAATQTRGFDEAMLRARGQAEQYARALPASETRPPFLIAVDVGNRIELYAEFSRSGATYTPFPDPRSYRIGLDDLRDEAIRERLRRVWTDPLALDPARASARVTREIAARLAELAKSLERSGQLPQSVAQFLMRCLFTMFAEDVGLLPQDAFLKLLGDHRDKPDVAMRMLGQLWRDMDAGGFCAAIASDVLRFNGKLFKAPDTLPLDQAQIALLIEAARAKWEHVEPAIFGTLLERALDPDERHKLGAHYTPRAYVERLVLPTIIEPLRAEWSDAQAAALTLAAEGKHDDAVNTLRAFHHRLCNVRVLDPACGSGNFLYVTLEHLKRLEGEVLNALDEFGFRQTGLALAGERADAMGGETVDPHNLLGIELNPRAAAIAEVVLWIGYLQWHYRTRGNVSPPLPVVRDFHNIECRDAVLACDAVEYVSDERGVPVTRWDGKTWKASPVTGEDVPDETARVPLERYVNPRRAAWPQADFIVGNPPFIGNKRMRAALGDGYVEALRTAWYDMPESADFVMYWWHHAALIACGQRLQRFGFITTNSIRQTFNRRVLEMHMADEPPKSAHERRLEAQLPGRVLRPLLLLVFAIPDHPWVDSADGAAVRIAMTVGDIRLHPGRLLEVVDERVEEDGEVAVDLHETCGVLHPDLRIGSNVADASPMRANLGVSFMGMIPLGDGFWIDSEEAQRLSVGVEAELRPHLRAYRNGKDILYTPRGILALDFFGMDEPELRARFPAAYQWLLERVKPSRANDKRKSYRDNWWFFAEARPALRRALVGLRRYIGTTETAKHRVFMFLDGGIIPDQKIRVIATDDSAILGVLSSCVHVVWALVAGSRLGVGNDPVYNNSRCFEPFPFPAANVEQQSRIRDLAEQLDAHRKRQQAAHPDLTLTGMYNVLDKLRSGEELTAKERTIHEHGLVSVLRQLHDELDAAVLDAYGWSELLPLLHVAYGSEAKPATTLHLPPLYMTREAAKIAFCEAILERLVALNAERAAEEARGFVRWLRAEFQNPQAQAKPVQPSLDTNAAQEDEVGSAKPAAAKPLPWPKDAVDQVRAVADALAASAAPLSVDEIAARFSGRGPWKKRLPSLLDMLVALGRARVDQGRYSSV
ncbi:DNA methyltransferase [Rudaea sp.]|uniref:class I SAM-dependent DNA methyltransferase n=1 Tax=Rudaea sp. TaxID=2136325 RepID=UPI0032201CAF